MNKFPVIPLLPILMLIAAGCQQPTIPSSKIEGSLKIDGDISDWTTRMYKTEDLPFGMGVENNNEFLYLCINTWNPSLAERLGYTGFSLFIHDPDDFRNGILLRCGGDGFRKKLLTNPDSAGMLRERGPSDTVSGFSNYMDVFGVRLKAEARVPAEQSGSMQFAATYKPGHYTCELAISRSLLSEVVFNNHNKSTLTAEFTVALLPFANRSNYRAEKKDGEMGRGIVSGGHLPGGPSADSLTAEKAHGHFRNLPPPDVPREPLNGSIDIQLANP